MIFDCYKLKLSVSKNWQLFSNFNTRQFWSQKQLKTNWAHFFEHKERPQWANIWQSLAILLRITQIFESLEAWPPVTLATRSWPSSCFSCISWSRNLATRSWPSSCFSLWSCSSSSSFFLPGNSYAMHKDMISTQHVVQIIWFVVVQGIKRTNMRKEWRKEKGCNLGGGYSVWKTLRGCTANMGSKISLFVYKWPLMKCKIWCMNGLIFQNFPKFDPNWLKFKKILEKSWVILLKSWRKIGRIGILMGHFFLKNWYLYGIYFQTLRWHIPTKTKLEYSPGVHWHRSSSWWTSWRAAEVSNLLKKAVFPTMQRGDILSIIEHDSRIWIAVVEESIR